MRINWEVVKPSLDRSGSIVRMNDANEPRKNIP
jgi:hypothetical protein